MLCTSATPTAKRDEKDTCCADPNNLTAFLFVLSPSRAIVVNGSFSVRLSRLSPFRFRSRSLRVGLRSESVAGNDGSPLPRTIEGTRTELT